MLCGGLQSITMQSLAFLEVDEGNYLRLTWEGGQGGHLRGPFPFLCTSLCAVGVRARLPVAVGGMRKIIKL